MGKAVSIPVKIIHRTEPRSARPARRLGVSPSSDGHGSTIGEQVKENRIESSLEAAGLEATRQDRGVGIETSPENDEQQFEEEGQWRDLALRLQAEMDNYRKRQRRLAQHQIWEERLRLLGAFLPVVDDLERALQAASAGEKPGLRRGVELTHRSAMQVLANEGVESISAEGQPFDPNLHEAVSTFPQSGRGVAPDTVIRVLEPGYRLGDRLLRPAKVVVAV